MSPIGHGQCRVIGGNPLSIGCTQLMRDPAHLPVLPTTIGKRLQLTLEIARVQTGQPGRACAIALTLQSVAGEAGVLRASATAAKCNQMASPGEPVAGACLYGRAGGEDDSRSRREDARPVDQHRKTRTGTARDRFPFPHRDRATALGAAAMLALVSTACKPPPDGSPSLPLASAARGKEAIERVGCGSCHTIAGVHWPQGRAAPELGDFAQRALIAGRVPNQPDLLAAFVRNAPAVAPGTTMPPMPLTEQESRDVAAYLYETGR